MVKRSLGSDEHVILSTRTHIKQMFKPLLALIVLIALFVVVNAFTDDPGLRKWLIPAVGAIVFVLFVWTVLIPFLRWRTTVYTFTSRRLITRQGIITRTGRDIPLFRINDFTYERGLLDRMLGCGTIVISDATEKAGVLLYDVPNVEEVQRKLADLLFNADDGSDDGEFPPTEPRRR